MKELRARLKASKEDHHEELKQLARELEEIKKEYLKLLVNEIMIVKQKVHLTGSYAALAGALCSKSEPGSLPGVPTSVIYWLPSADSNHGHGG